jgi:D-galactarolactone cycloisomerase
VHKEPKIRPYATGLYFTDKEHPSKDFEEEVKQYLAMGFKAIKMKVGLGIEKDFQHVKKMRQLIGDDCSTNGRFQPCLHAKRSQCTC